MSKFPVVLTFAFTLGGCAMLRPADSEADSVEVFTNGPPTTEFKKVAELAFWVPKSGMGEPTIDDILPELRERAKEAGADAVMDVHWTLRGVNDFGSYQVTAIAISYVVPADAAAAPSMTGSSHAK